MSDKFINETGLGAIRTWLLSKLSGKQDTLVSGTNIKTVNNQSLLGSGDITIGGGSYLLTDGSNADNSGFTVLSDAVEVRGTSAASLVSASGDVTVGSGSGNVLIVSNSGAVEIWGLVTPTNGDDAANKQYVDDAVAPALGMFLLKDFNQQVNLTIPHCNQDIANTSIPNMDVDLDVIDPTGNLNQEYAIASLAKYEVYDATSGGNRLNCWPVCSFSMNGQRTLRLRMLCAGTTSKTARRIQGALLLKHR